jgi:GNAT superfamily N-acetyltransferase
VQFYRPAPLDQDKHRRDEFDSGEPSQDEWLRRYAGQNRRGNAAAVWVVADSEYRVACYSTLSMTAVDRSACPTPLAKGAPAQVPALLIGRLATDQRAAGMGAGTRMVAHVLATAAELNVEAACRAVVVTALTPAAFAWWQNFGFTTFDRSDPANLELYLLSKDIAATLTKPNEPKGDAMITKTGLWTSSSYRRGDRTSSPRRPARGVRESSGCRFERRRCPSVANADELDSGSGVGEPIIERCDACMGVFGREKYAAVRHLQVGARA